MASPSLPVACKRKLCVPAARYTLTLAELDQVVQAPVAGKVILAEAILPFTTKSAARALIAA
ncbi:hypothetical protein D3C87_2183270 [compost metagenome]